MDSFKQFIETDQNPSWAGGSALGVPQGIARSVGAGIRQGQDVYKQSVYGTKYPTPQDAMNAINKSRNVVYNAIKQAGKDSKQLVDYISGELNKLKYWMQRNTPQQPQTSVMANLTWIPRAVGVGLFTTIRDIIHTLDFTPSQQNKFQQALNTLQEALKSLPSEEGIDMVDRIIWEIRKI